MLDLLEQSNSATIPTMIGAWEDASALLANAFANYLKLSTFLETSHLQIKENANDLVSRIDSSLQTLHVILEQQLHQSCVVLAKTRNRLASPIYCFPEEILSEIFMCATYGPEEDILFGPPCMADRVRTMYHRLYNLMGVCTIWRNVGLNRPDFWNIIPMVDGTYNCWRPLSVELCMQRSGRQNIHLAVDASHHLFACYRREDFQPVYEDISRLKSVNVRSEHPQDIPNIIVRLLNYAPNSLTHLSLCYFDNHDEDGIHRPDPEANSYNKLFEPLHPQFTKLMNSLSVFRIRNAAFSWKYVTFSTRLVELRVDSIALPGNSAIISFMAALSSARELRDLKVIHIEAFADRGSALPRSQLKLPKLQTLYLENLYLNFLTLLLASITPRSYRLTLNASPRLQQNLLADSVIQNVNIEDMRRILAHYPINKLILADGEPDWPNGPSLHYLLRSLLDLKTIIINSYKLDNKFMKALEPPSSARNIPFPQLETIEFRQCTIPGSISGLKSLVAKHPIKRLVLGQDTLPPGADSLVVKLTEKDSIVRWLKANVSGFHFIRDDIFAPEFSDIIWQLWDL